MIHQLKCLPEYFSSIADCKKPFEIREKDRDYQVGDFLALNEAEIIAEVAGGAVLAKETGKCLLAKVSYILDEPRYCKDGMVVMGISPCVIFHAHDGCPVYDREGAKDE